MDIERIHSDRVVSRRTILKSMVGVAAACSLPAAVNGLAMPRRIRGSINPRWYGFNLLEYFSIDPDWMKYFPYRNDGNFKEDDFRWMRDWGFNWVRLPMDYRFWTDPQDLMKIEEKKVEPIDRAIRLGEKYKIHVNICLLRAPGEYILNGLDEKLSGIHITRERTSVYRDPRTLDAFVHQWAYFARRYKGIPPTQLSFDLVNEPDEKTAPTVDRGREDYARVAKAAISAVRGIDPDRLIVTDGYPIGTGPIPELFDTGIVQSAHNYLPGDLTGYRDAWLRYPGSDKVPVPTWPLKDEQGKIVSDKQTIKKRLAPWGELAKHNVPIHFGEMGCGRYTPPNVVYAWFRDSLDVLDGLRSGWALWNFRGPFGILDTNRAGTQYKDWHGHRLDFTLLHLLQSKMNA